MFNESEKGNLSRCLENVKQWADDIVIYDDASTDNSVEIASKYTQHIIKGEVNCINEELFHKQTMLEYALTLNPDWLMWIDCDEILDREGTTGGLRALAETATADAYSFHEVNLWRSQTYARLDTLFNKGWFCRLWRVVPGITFQTQVGVHLRLYPITIDVEKIVRSDISVIHYGFWDYKKMLVKIGAHYQNKEQFQEIAEKNWILNETKCNCYRVPDEMFPIENVPADMWVKPRRRAIVSLEGYQEKETEMDYTQTMAWWEKQAPTYFTDKVYSFSVPSLIEKLEITKESHVLEIGFGYGRELSQFCKLSDYVYGVELFQVTCDLARETVGNKPSLYIYDGLHLPFQEDQFDVVYSCFVLQHMSRSSARTLLTDVMRVLKPGGKALMEFYGDPAFQHDTNDMYSGIPGEGGMYNNAYNWPNVNAIALGLGEILWIEGQNVSVDKRNFQNFWLGMTK